MPRPNSILTLLALGGVTLICSTAALAEPSKQKGMPAGRPPTGGLFARLDQNGDGKIVRAEARSAMTEFFARMDKNGDGNLTQDEQPEPPGRSHRTKDPGSHFARMDKNGDGKVERSETRMPEEHFTNADANKDGKLTQEELKTAFEKMVLARKTQKFSELDGNGDGKIDQKEALAHADQRFTELDANKDGHVTHDEAQKGLAGKHSARKGHAKRHGRHGDCHEEGEGKSAGPGKGQAI